MADEAWSRRSFLSRTAKAAGLALVAGGGGLAFHRPPGDPFAPQAVRAMKRDLRVAGASQALSVVHGADPAAVVRASLKELGGMGAFVHRGETVLVKPNIGWDRTPEQGANTNPALVRAVIEECFAAGAAKVIVTDITCNATDRCFARSGIAEAAQAAGAIVEKPVESRFREVEIGGSVLGKQLVYGAFLEADRIINIPVAKHHSLTGATIGLKNLYGILGGNRSRLHQHIHESLADLCAFLCPTLTIVDAVRVLRRNGPAGGSLSDVERHDTVAACTDPVAMDAWAAETFFSIHPDAYAAITLAAQRGIGTADWRTLQLRESTVQG